MISEFSSDIYWFSCVCRAYFCLPSLSYTWHIFGHYVQRWTTSIQSPVWWFLYHRPMLFLTSLPIFPCFKPKTHPSWKWHLLLWKLGVCKVAFHQPCQLLSQVHTVPTNLTLFIHFQGTVHLFWAMASLHSTLHTVGAQYILRGLCVLRNILLF